MRKVVIVVVAVLALAVAGGAGAIAKTLLVAKRGDSVLISETNILCQVQAGSNFTCFKTKDGRKPLAKSYGVGISPKGVTVGYFASTSTPVKIVWQRRHGLAPPKK